MDLPRSIRLTLKHPQQLAGGWERVSTGARPHASAIRSPLNRMVAEDLDFLEIEHPFEDLDGACRSEKSIRRRAASSHDGARSL